MSGWWRRARCLPIVVVACCVTLVGPPGASGGFGSPPPIHPGEVAFTLFPHTTSVLPSAVARDGSGRIVVAGSFTGYAGAAPAGVAVARFATSGSADASFGSDGASTSTGVFPSTDRVSVQVVTPLADGGIVVGGSFANEAFLERFGADGTLDRGYGSGGLVTVTGPAEERVLAVSELADGTLVFVHVVTQALSGGAVDAAPGGLTVDRLTRDGARIASWTYAEKEWTSGQYAGYGEWSAAHVYGDGSVLAAGFMEIPYTLPCPCPSSTQVVLRRFEPDGSIETSFGSGGRATAVIGSSGAIVESLAVEGDGTFVVGGLSGSPGDAFAARFLPSGTPDRSFGQNGAAIGSGGDAGALALGPDGSVFLGSVRDGDLTVVKIDGDGAPAAAFGRAGLTATKSAGWIAGLFPTRDGGVDVVYRRALESDVDLGHYSASGTLDVGSATSISVGLPPPSGALAIRAVPNAIVVAGYARDDRGRSGIHVAVMPSRGFGVDGEASAFVGSRSRATTVDLDSFGRVVVGGDSTSDGARRWIVARFDAQGTLDTAFGTGGVASSGDSGLDDGVRSLAVTRDDGMFALVRESGREVVVRLHSDGTPDLSFGHGGHIVAPVSGAAALVVLDNGDAVVAGDGLACVWVDSSGDVIAHTDAVAPSAAAAGIAVQADGSLVVAGTDAAGVVVTRLLPSAVVDTTFGSSGVVARAGLDAVGVAVQRDGRITVAVRAHGGSQYAAIRFLYTGQSDDGFGDGGLATVANGGTVSAIADLGQSILLAGTAPAPRGTDFALTGLYEDPPVADPAVGTLFHVTPRGGARQIQRNAGQAAWSQAAHALAYVADDAGVPDIWIRRKSGPRRLTSSPLPGGVDIAAFPEWSQDGRLLAVHAVGPTGEPAIAIVGGLDGHLRATVNGFLGGWMGGHDLAFTTVQNRVDIVDVDTGKVRDIAAGWYVVPSPRGNALAVWSAKGWRLVSNHGTYIAQLPAMYDPSWASDGRHLVALAKGGLVVSDLHGRLRKLRVSAGEEARGPVWSPDGSRIAFVDRIAGDYSIEFVDAHTGRQLGHWGRTGHGFVGADPVWDATGVYVPSG